MTQPNAYQPESQLPPTPEGLIIAVDATLALHGEAIQHIEPEPGDMYGRTGGDELVLYPNPKDPREVLRIAPVGQDANDRRFPAKKGLHIVYDGRGTEGTEGIEATGTYRIYSNRVDLWTQDPDLAHAVNASSPNATKFAGLIDAMGRASTERPAGRTKRVMQKLGSLAGN